MGKWFKRGVAGLACAAAFGVTYALVLPASALNRDAGFSCGLEEHRHRRACCERICVCDGGEAHAHTDGCYEEILVCDREAHAHGDACVK